MEVKNLTKIYGSQRAVDAISFTAAPGQVLGFLGPNGAGKSTTMKIATGYLAPSAGTVLVNGFDVQEAPRETRRSLGYLPEHNPLYLDMYVREYLLFVGSLYGLKSNYLNARIGQMVEQCGLAAEQKKKIGSLSKGYRQRVGLAQALIHDPAVLILDEPTTGLDPNQLIEIRELIKSVGQRKTVIFSTHILQEVTAICDRVVIINQGKIVADSSVASLNTLGRHEVYTLAEFEHPIETSLLEQVPGMLAVQPVNAASYRLKSRPGSDIRSAVFALAAQHKWSLIGLRQEEHSLEKIFQALTK